MASAPIPLSGTLRGLFCLLWVAAASAGLVDAHARQQATSEQVTSEPEGISEVQSLEKRADLYMVRKYYAEAADAYRKLIALQPKDAVHHNKLGIAYHQLQDFASAKKSYRRAIQLNSKYAQAINNLAAVEYAQKNYRAAILTYLKALKLSPYDAVMYSNLGTAYFAHERYDYAMTSYRYALQLDPTIFQRSGRAGTIVHQRDEKNAAVFNFYLAKTYASLGNVEDTLQCLRKAWEEGFPDILEALEDKVFEFLATEPRYLELRTLIENSLKTESAASTQNR